MMKTSSMGQSRQEIMKSSIDLSVPIAERFPDEYIENDIMSTPSNNGDVTMNSDIGEVKLSDIKKRREHFDSYTDKRAYEILQKMKAN
jgi:hypothetical protein